MKRVVFAAMMTMATFLFAEGVTAYVLCFLKGEQISGMNKICFYDCLGSAAAITISSVQLCPLNIRQ